MKKTKINKLVYVRRMLTYTTVCVKVYVLVYVCVQLGPHVNPLSPKQVQDPFMLQL